MKTTINKTLILISALGMLLLSTWSCKKDDGLVSYSGYVVNDQDQKVSLAFIHIYNTKEDWVSGENKVSSLVSDADGYFESDEIFEPGEYYIYIQKRDSSNWIIKEIANDIYPKISIPEDKELKFEVVYNHMVRDINTKWALSNVHKEYTKPGETAVEWQSIWNSINNCKRDNYIYFNIDLTLRISEEETVCKGARYQIYASLVPQDISKGDPCIRLPHTAHNVKELLFRDWPEMQDIGGRLFMTCDASNPEIYLYYPDNNGAMTLDVYSKTK